MSGVDTTARQHGILADFRAAAEEKCAGLKDDLRVTDDRYVPKKFNIEVKKWKSRKGAELMAAFVGSWPEQNSPISEIARLHYIFKGAREKEVAEVIAKGWREQLLKRRAENQPEPNTLPADPAPPLDLLPDGSWLLDVPFTLKSDLICRDDASMYVIDNPVKKDRVNGYPEYWGPSWKGILRHAFQTAYGADTEVEQRLFGTTKRSGRLRFFTTRFGRTGLVVIHPSARKPAKAGVPIFIETVPPGTPGVFRLLYCPFDGAWSRNIEAEREEDAKEAGEAVRCMFDLGLGAKSSSGFGEASRDRADVLPKTLEPQVLAWTKLG